jgi:hypothetical protein
MRAPYEITLFTKDGGPLTKEISLDPDGKLVSDGSACVMSHGWARRVPLNSPQELADLTANLASHDAIALGPLRSNLPDAVEVVTKSKLGGATRSDVIARMQDFLSFRPGAPAFTLIDVDIKGMPADVRERIALLGGYWAALVKVLPELATVAHVARRSTSAGLFNTGTGETIHGSGGVHFYVALKNGEDGERFLKVLHERCWLAGLGWIMVGAGGQLLERSIVDRMVGAPERLVFEGPPVLVPPLGQDVEWRRPQVIAGEMLDSLTACPPLTVVGQCKLQELRIKETRRLAPESAMAREAFIDRQARQLAARTGGGLNHARRIIEQQCDGGVLLPDIVLPFDEAGFAGCTVADVLADPDQFVGDPRGSARGA